MAAVTLHVYDLSNGVARQMSPMLLGRQIDAIFHTGVVAFGQEFYFGGGICADPPGRTPYGSPIRVVPMGATRRTRNDFMSFLASVAPRFTVATYHLLDNNCNHFSQCAAEFLVPGASIPQEIIDLPLQAMDSPLGPVLRPFVDDMQRQIQAASAGHEAVGLAGVPATLPATSAPKSDPLASCYALCPIRFDVGKTPQILAKLKELDPQFSASHDDVDALSASLDRVSADRAFPALDLLRLAALGSRSHAVSCLAAPLSRRYLTPGSDTPRATRMMALRLLTNVMSCASWETSETSKSLGEEANGFVDMAVESLDHDHKLVRNAAAAVACNISFYARGTKFTLTEESWIRLVYAVCERLSAMNMAEEAKDTREAKYLVASLGFLTEQNDETRLVAQTMEVELSKFKVGAEVDPVLDKCATEVEHVLQRGSA